YSWTRRRGGPSATAAVPNCPNVLCHTSSPVAGAYAFRFLPSCTTTSAAPSLPSATTPGCVPRRLPVRPSIAQTSVTPTVLAFPVSASRATVAVPTLTTP